MTFHPAMDYGRGHHVSARELPEEGPPFVYTAANRATLDEICARYPSDQRKSAILAALYLAQEQQGYLTRNAMRHAKRSKGSKFRPRSCARRWQRSAQTWSVCRVK